MCCNDSVVGKKLNEPVQGQDSPVVQSIIAVLDRVATLVKETPAEENSTSRFGNPAFRSLYSKVQQESRSMHESIPGMRNDAIIEVDRYFVECFGNEKRIDYGSGMELNFACWL
jgi:serine/threonine-protein phosphatase 2A activator